MNTDEGAAAKDVESDEALPAPEDQARNDSMRDLVTLAIMGAGVIAFLALCLPMYIL